MLREQCENIASIITDYRQGQVPTPDAAHVGRWISQFPQNVREPLLAEMAHILLRTYASKEDVKRFFEVVVTSKSVVGDDPVAFWQGVHFLRLQQVGNSQRDLLTMFDNTLEEVCGFGLADCGAKPHTYVYLDDGVFSGSRVKSDLIRWITEDAPSYAKVLVIVEVVHRQGEFFAKQDIAEAAKRENKIIDVEWRCAAEFEDCRKYMGDSDVLRPKSIPIEANDYVASLGSEPILRTGDSVGRFGVFSGPMGRELIEQEFLKAGVRVRQLCTNFNAYMRPLGCTTQRTTGFGSMFVTYRNIANNTPLVLWAGNPWYPLFPRRTN